MSGFIIWQLSEKKIKRPNATRTLVLCVRVCVFSIPYNHETKPEVQEQEAGFKGVKGTCILKGLNTALQKRKNYRGWERNSLHLPIIPFFHPPAHTSSA